MTFQELIANSHRAVLRCLYRVLLPDGNKLKLSVNDYHSINQEFSFFNTVRNAEAGTYITRRYLEAGFDSLFVGNSKEVQKTQTRVSFIVSSFLKDATRSLPKARRKGAPEGSVILTAKSPLSVVVEILSDPEAAETTEIALFFSKLRLMELHNINLDVVENGSSEETRVQFSDLDKFYSSLEKFVRGRDQKAPSSPEQKFLSELVAVHGFIDMRSELPPRLFETEAKTLDGCFDEFANYIDANTEYRKADDLVSLPSIAEIANLVFGIPIALNGFNKLLNGGLRQGAGEGTVTLLRGGAGSGKTSLAISIQRCIEALGIPTIFLSSEERFEALDARRDSVLNLAQKNHPCFASQSAPSEIVTTEARSKAQGGENEGIYDLVHALATSLRKKERSDKKVAQFARLFLVIGGIHNYLDDDKDEIRKLIDECRKTNTHVLITSSDDWAHSEGIEYFVDNYFSLSRKEVLEPMPHTLRGISILKTRHQSSLVGNHEMRFQDEGDLSFTPNFSELLKLHSRTVANTPNRGSFSYPFMLDFPDKDLSDQARRMANLEHYENSVTLLYGRGSASKTSLCMRFLATPNENGKNNMKRILVVSFLHPHKYYSQKRESFVARLRTSLTTRMSQKKSIEASSISESDIEEDYPGWKEIHIETISFTPGMISAEEVYTAVSDKLRGQGESKYSGVLFDGLHNVFVQFPLIEKHPELWSALINLVRRVDVKTVLTFTDFEVWGARTLSTVDYENTRAKPLLVALTQSIDFGFGLVPLNQVGDSEQGLAQADLFHRDNPGLFILSSFMAHSQAAPTDYLLWDRTTESIRPPT